MIGARGDYAGNRSNGTRHEGRDGDTRSRRYSLKGRLKEEMCGGREGSDGHRGPIHGARGESRREHDLCYRERCIVRRRVSEGNITVAFKLEKGRL